MNPRFSNINVLIAEDEETSRLILCEILSDIGVKNCIAARNGEDALDRFLGESVDLVITDWNMQPMDGLALTWAIRKIKNGASAKTPIIMLTGVADHSAVLNARKLGISQFLAKPVDSAELASRMRIALTEPVSFVRHQEIYVADMPHLVSPPPLNQSVDTQHIWEI